MNLSATMDLKAGAFAGPLAQATNGMKGMIGHMRELVPLVTGLGGAFAAFKGAESIVENFFKQFEKGHELERLHRQTGESVQDLVVLKKALSVAGVDDGGLPRYLALLQKSLGGVNEEGQPTKFIFSQIGLDIEKLKQLRAPEQFEQIGAKIRGLATPAERTAAAMGIFGRSGAELLAVLNDPDALKEAIASASSIGALYQRNAKIFSEISVLMLSIKGKVNGLFAGLAEGAAPAFKAILTWVKEIDLAKIGRDIGGILRAIPAAIQQGKIGDLLELTLQAAFAKGINYFTAAFSTSISVFGTVLGAVFENLGSIGDVLIGAAAQFGAAMLKAVNVPLAYVQGFFETLASTKITDLISLASGNTGIFAQMMGESSVRGSDILKNGGPKFGFGGEAMTAGQLGELGKAQTTQGLNNLRKPIIDLVGDLATAFKSFKVDDVAGAGKAVADLKALLNQLVPPMKNAAEGAEGGAGGASLTGVKLAKIEGDRLSRVGGFIGGAGGPALDYARRTAAATEKLVGIISNAGRIPAAGRIETVWA